MTLGEIVAATRGKLDDKLGPKYLWENEELARCVVETINELCLEVRLIEDATTEALVKFTLLANAYLITTSSRVTGVARAKLASQQQPLERVQHVRDMDEQVSNWEAAASDVPKAFIADGVGTNRIRLWPPTLAADTLWLTVTRLPLSDLTWAADENNSPEIPTRYHDQLYDGIMARAYMKDDTDTLDLRKAEKHEKKWAEKIEAIKTAEAHRAALAGATVVPQAGWM